MFKKIWQSFMRRFRKLLGRGAKSPERVNAAPLPPLDDTDREYLFMQLLEGVAHGWQQPRAIGFFNKIRHRVRKSEWIEWLDKFGQNAIAAPVPNYELAGRMVQLGQLDCGEVGDLAAEYGNRLLNRQAEELSMEFLPIMEFDAAQPELMTINRYDDSGELMPAENRLETFDDVPPELLIDHHPSETQPQRSFQSQEEESNTETREITLEEFATMLHKDPSLVAELAEQFGIETNDPNVIVNAVIAQMQQQVQPLSGDLNAPADESINPAAATPIEPPPPPLRQNPPPPPPRRMEYKSEDPWIPATPASEDSIAETAKSIDRSV